jgi:hypothetical protein
MLWENTRRLRIQVALRIQVRIYFCRFEQKIKKTIIVLPWLGRLANMTRQREPAVRVGVIKVFHVETILENVGERLLHAYISRIIE